MPINLTKTIKTLLALYVGVFILQQTMDQFFGGNFVGTFGLVPSEFVLGFKFWQIFTYSFLHGDVLHLVLNSLMLAFIGGEIEGLWGRNRFLRYYFFCIALAGMAYVIVTGFLWGRASLGTPMVGASGGLYGLLLAYGIIYGERVMLMMMLFPMKAKYFVVLLGGIEFLHSVFSPRGGLSSVAHLAGMVAGFGYLWVQAKWKSRKAAKGGTGSGGKKKSHLKLVVDNNDDKKPKLWH